MAKKSIPAAVAQKGPAGVNATEELIARLPIHPEKFDVYGCCIFGVLPDADPIAVRTGADLLLDMALKLSLVGSGSADFHKVDAVLLAQFLTEAAQASYRSLLGAP